VLAVGTAIETRFHFLKGDPVGETDFFDENSKYRSVKWQLPGLISVIAEVGINHNGDLALAKQLIDIAVDSGCDAVKFQKRTIDVVYTAEVLDSPRESPWGATQRAQKEGLEFSRAQYEEINAYCQDKGIAWSASAWDIPSLDFIEEFDPPFHKVASAMLTHRAFIEEVASKGRTTLISTGMATLEIIDEVVEVFKKVGTPFVLLHTVSTYPSPEADLNLSMIHTLHERYGVPVGYSGHEPSVSPSIVAASLGASVIERHITIDRTMYGSDQAASLEENGLRQLVSVIRKIPAMLGTGEKDWAPGEREVAGKLRYWESTDG
jgi:N-acetylneuraminate synthase